jgi:uncharacterized membrane protein
VDGADANERGRSEIWLGLILVLSSAVAWSTMGLFVRMVPDADVWTVVFWRSLFGGCSIVALAMVERRRLFFDWRKTMTPQGLAITTLIASGVFSSIYSMQNTTIANGCVIYSTAPFMAAVLAWIWFRERPGRRTVICTVIASAGVVVTVSGTLAAGGGHLKGDLAMVYGTFALTMMTVITRRYRETPMLESVAIACFMAASPENGPSLLLIEGPVGQVGRVVVRRRLGEQRPHVDQRADIFELARYPEPGIGIDADDRKPVEDCGRHHELPERRRISGTSPFEFGDFGLRHARDDQHDISERTVLLVERPVCDPYAGVDVERQEVGLAVMKTVAEDVLGGIGAMIQFHGNATRLAPPAPVQLSF